ncbi:hypothetical protein QBC43DRAFT_317393 [Cladorrhinum sp. PSN259]|nr:hypothetical protein QBC43DRAFT_317393 [Cladorrhinum sp. PSN259]
MALATMLIRAIPIIPTLFSLQAHGTAILSLTSAAPIGPSPANLTKTRAVVYQSTDGALHVRTHAEPWQPPQRIPPTIPPKLKTPLAACVWKDLAGKETLALYYLNAANRIVLSTGHFDGAATATWSSWAGRFVTSRRSSGSGLEPGPETSLAVVPSSGTGKNPCVGTARLYYLDKKSQIVERTGDGAVRKVGPRAMKGSKISAVGIQGSDDVYVFYVAPDGALRCVRGQGLGGEGSWAEAQTILPNFASSVHPAVHLAAAAWSAPLVTRLFWIDERGRPAELVSRSGGAWIRIPDTDDFELSNPKHEGQDDDGLPAASSLGGPIAVTAGVIDCLESDREFVEVFFVSADPTDGITNMVRKPGQGWVVGDFGGTDPARLAPGTALDVQSRGVTDSLTLADKLMLSVAILAVVATLVAGVLPVMVK